MGQSRLRGPGPLELRCGREEELVKVTENDRQRGKVHGHSRDYRAKSKVMREAESWKGRGAGWFGHQEGGDGRWGCRHKCPLLGKTIKVGVVVVVVSTRLQQYWRHRGEMVTAQRT